jgi:hypothetical protein
MQQRSQHDDDGQGTDSQERHLGRPDGDRFCLCQVFGN